jgi:hypothetical protein
MHVRHQNALAVMVGEAIEKARVTDFRVVRYGSNVSA